MIQDDDPRLDLHFLAVRQAIGFLGLSLPLILLIYGQSGARRMQPTMSDFYYTGLGDVFVGLIVAIGVFLITYKGYSARPERFHLGDFGTSLIAGVAAVFVALFPTHSNPDTALCLTGGAIAVCNTLPDTTLLTGLHTVSGPLHYIAAGIFFACLAYFCLVLFPMGGKRHPDGSAALSLEHLVYYACGGAIVTALVAIGLLFALAGRLPEAVMTLNPIFWAEAVAVWAFAIAWLTKGNVLSRPLGLRLSRAG